MEREIYYKLETNDESEPIVFDGLSAIKDLIEADISNVHPNEAGNLVYTITPVLMTEEEFRNT